jgi:hypothetical protein
MRDLIWTIIGIWFLWRIIEAFRSYSPSRKSTAQSSSNRTYTSASTNHTENTSDQPSKKGELRSDAGEYVDFEEVK